MLKISFTAKMKKDLKLAKKRGYDLNEFNTVLNMLVKQEQLPEQYHDHQLSGRYKGHRECHIEPDWLLIYKIENDILTLTLTRTGTHSDLFKL